MKTACYFALWHRYHRLNDKIRFAVLSKTNTYGVVFANKNKRKRKKKCLVDEEWKSFACGILECDELQYIMYMSFTLCVWMSQKLFE